MYTFQHAPRFFVVQPDLTGTELLRREDIAEYISAADQEADTAVIRESVIEHPGNILVIPCLELYTHNIPITLYL